MVLVQWRFCGLISIDVLSQITPKFLWTCLHCSCQLHTMDDFIKHMNAHRMDGIYLADEQSIQAAVSSSAETKHEPVSNSGLYEESTLDDSSSTVSSFQASVSKEQIERFAGGAEVQHMMLQKREKKDVMPEIVELGSKKSNQLSMSLNRPAAIEDLAGDRVPPSLEKEAAEVQRMGGIEHLTALINELPALLQRNEEIVDESERALNEEEISDRQLRAQFRQKWTPTPSEVLNQRMWEKCTEYRKIINSAVQADTVVTERYFKNRDAIALLSQPDINHAEFGNAKVQSQTGIGRDYKLKELASAYDSFIQLKGNIGEGKKFYLDLTQLLVKFQSKVTDFCWARKAEKDDLLKDMSTNQANQAASPPPQPSGPAASATPVFFSEALPPSFNPYFHFSVGS